MLRLKHVIFTALLLGTITGAVAKGIPSLLGPGDPIEPPKKPGPNSPGLMLPN